MTGRWRPTALGLLVAGMVLTLWSSPSMAAPSGHVYLLRGLMNIFSLGMDTLATELNRRGVSTTVDNHADWQLLADQAATNYRAGREGPIILIGHSLGANAVMEMANYLGTKGIPVALVVPFDATESFSASANVARVLNFTKFNYMRRGPGFHGSLVNVDLRADPTIDHLTIDKSPRLHARVIAEVLAIVGGHRAGETSDAAKPTVSTPVPDGTNSAISAAPDSGNIVKPSTDGGTPVIALPERSPVAKPVVPQPN
jgi:Thioesterase domain